jgi:putative ABC transport system permease protein
LREAGQSISARPLKSSLTILGATIGVAAFAMVTSLTNTTRAQVNDQFESLAPTEVVVSDTQPEPVALAFPPDTEQLADRVNGVVSSGLMFQVGMPITPGITRLAPGMDDGKPNSIRLVGASPGLFPAVVASLGGGRAFAAIADQRQQDVLVLGEGAASQLGIRDISSQPAVFVDGIPFTVVGIVTSVQRETSLLQAAIIPEQTALKYWGVPANGADVIVSTRPGSAGIVAAQLPAAILPSDPSRLVVVTPTRPFILQAVINGEISRLLLLTGVVALLIGAIGIASMMLTTVLERFYEIGVRRALGATRLNIVTQFLAESTILGACGGVVGTCIAVILIVLISNANGWFAVLNPLTILPDPLIGAVVGCIAGTYSAFRAALLNPVEALRR